MSVLRASLPLGPLANGKQRMRGPEAQGFNIGERRRGQQMENGGGDKTTDAAPNGVGRRQS